MIDSSHVKLGASIYHMDNPTGFHVCWADDKNAVVDHAGDYLKIRIKWVTMKDDFTIDTSRVGEKVDSYIGESQVMAEEYTKMVETSYPEWIAVLRQSRNWGLD